MFSLWIMCGFSITTRQSEGISRDTVQLAPILQLSPMVMPPIIVVPAPMKTLFPIFGDPVFFESGNIFDPIVTL